MRIKYDPEEKITYAAPHFAFFPTSIEVWEDGSKNTYTVFWSFYWHIQEDTNRERGIVGGVQRFSFKEPKDYVYHPALHIIDFFGLLGYATIIGVISEILF